MLRLGIDEQLIDRRLAQELDQMAPVNQLVAIVGEVSEEDIDGITVDERAQQLLNDFEDISGVCSPENITRIEF